MRKSSAAKALVLVSLVGAGCGQGREAPVPGKSVVKDREVLDGWMGRYGRRDEALRVLLAAQEGWATFRDMELADATELFSGANSGSDRIGEARAYLELAAFYEALDRFFAETESRYLDTLGAAGKPEERARGALAKLRIGDVRGARAALSAAGTEATGAVRAIGQAGISAAEGRKPEAESWIQKAEAASKDANERALVEVACYWWGLGAGEQPVGPWGRAASALKSGEFAAAARALDSAVLRPAARSHGVDVFVYGLRRRVCGGLALAALGAPSSPDAFFLAAQAKEHLGDDLGAADFYAKAAEAKSPGTDAVWLFSPATGPAEGARLAAALRGAALHRAGRAAQAGAIWDDLLKNGEPGPLVSVSLARWQDKLGLSKPYEKPTAVAEASLATVRAEYESLPKQDPTDLLPSLYPTRIAAVSRAAADVAGRRGDSRAALEALESAHRKAAGYRADFVNPPAFLVDLARAYADTGGYASAVAVLFELNRQFSAVRPAYENLKRLYAAKTGGGAQQPRY